MEIQSTLNFHRRDITKDNKEKVTIVTPTVDYKLIKNTLEEAQIKIHRKSYTIDLYA